MDTAARPNVDVVTVVWRETREQLDRFASGLEAAWRALPPERRGRSILVESGTDAAIADHAAVALERVVGSPPHRVRLRRNGGPAAGYNHGFAKAASGYVALLDPDGAPDSQMIAALAAALDARGSAALAAAEVLAFDAAAPAPGEAAAVEWASAGATLYRLDAFQELGGFDELFAYTCEEMDFGYRARNAGWECLRVPVAFRHEVGHKTSWRREWRYLEFIMVWRHVHFARLVTVKSWLRQFPYLLGVGRTAGWRVAAGGALGLLAYLRHIPACERRR